MKIKNNIYAGDLTPEATAEIIHGCADMIEPRLPIAGDPTIQASIERVITRSDELMPALTLPTP